MIIENLWIIDILFPSKLRMLQLCSKEGVYRVIIFILLCFTSRVFNDFNSVKTSEKSNKLFIRGANEAKTIYAWVILMHLTN